MPRTLFPVLLVLSLLLVGCGSSNTPSTSTTSTPAPTATSTTPPPPAGGTPTGGSGGSSGGSGSGGSGSGGSGGSGGTGGATGGGSEQPRAYSEGVFPIGSFGSGGNVTVNPGTTTIYAITFAGGTNDGASNVARFCPFAVQGCTTLTDPPTFRNSGGMQFMGTFPGHGTFSGEFVVSRNGVDTWASGFSLPPNGSVAFGTGATPFEPQLVRAAAVSAGLGAEAQFGIGTDPLTDGTAVVTQPDGTVHPSVTGASPNTTYTVSYCNPAGANCTALGTLTTDGSGNGSAALSIKPIVVPGDLNSGQFKLSRNGANGPVEFVTGFIVP